MTSTLLTDFWNDCFVHGNVAPLINYTVNPFRHAKFDGATSQELH